jgi:hypothetical protein
VQGVEDTYDVIVEATLQFSATFVVLIIGIDVLVSCLLAHQLFLFY